MIAHFFPTQNRYYIPSSQYDRQHGPRSHRVSFLFSSSHECDPSSPAPASTITTTSSSSMIPASVVTSSSSSPVISISTAIVVTSSLLGRRRGRRRRLGPTASPQTSSSGRTVIVTVHVGRDRRRRNRGEPALVRRLWKVAGGRGWWWGPRALVPRRGRGQGMRVPGAGLLLVWKVRREEVWRRRRDYASWETWWRCCVIVVVMAEL